MERKSSTLRNFRGDAGGLQGATWGTGEEEEEEEEREKDEHERKGQSMVGEMRVGRNNLHSCASLLFLMSWQWPLCVSAAVLFFFFFFFCGTHRAAALAAATAHLAAYRDEGAQLIRPQSEGRKKIWKRKMGRGKKEILKGDLKYAEGDRASP